MGHTKYPAYLWKLCPYSLQYKTEYYDKGLPGPTNHVEIHNNPVWTPLTTTTHNLYEGGMIYRNMGSPGWVCMDTNCYYYTTVNPGQRFFEC